MIKVEQKLWTQEAGWATQNGASLDGAPQLVFVFGSRALMEDPKIFEQIRGFYPGSFIVLGSTAGEILDTKVRDNSIALTAVHFEKTVVRFAETNIEDLYDSMNVGKRLAEFLPVEGLVHAMVFCDGLHVNGTSLVTGINNNLPPTVSVTGGLVGDGSDFRKTVVGLDGPGKEKKVVLLGFYGAALKVGFGSLGGWDASEDTRSITKSKDNVLYELDGKPALAVYKEYLGSQAQGLPSTGLLFPLRLETEGGSDTEVVRTILAVNEADQSITFAGDMPEGAKVTFMKANFERLIEGASKAGVLSLGHLEKKEPQLAILVSCVGRKLVLRERIGEEVQAVRSVLGKTAAITGFYSYGELCPSAAKEKQCLLHNQTMTITAFRED